MPPSRAVSMAMRMHQSNAGGIAQCSMSRATPEATGRCHRATSHSLLPQRPPGQQSTKQRCKIHLLYWPFWWPLRCGSAIPSALTNKGGPRAFLEATKCRHQVRFCSNSIDWTWQCRLFVVYFIVKSSKKATQHKVKRWPLITTTIGVWHIKLMRIP